MIRLPSSHRSFLRTLAIVALGSVLAACVGVHVPKLPTVGLPTHWRNAPELGVKPDLTDWWQHFHDPELDTLVTRALKDNSETAQAAWKLRAARVLEKVSGAKFKPQVAFDTTEEPNPQGTASYFQAGFDSTWEINLFGRAGANGHIAEANVEAAAAELQSARVSLVAEVIREYLALRAAQRSDALSQQAVRSAEETVRLLRVRERLQLASKSEVAQAVAAVSKAKARLADPQTEIAKSAQTLALLLGKSEPDPAWLKPSSLPRLEGGNVASLPANLLRTRPEIRYAETQVLKAAGELGIAKANLYPRLILAGALTVSTRVQGHGREGGTHAIGGIGPIINIPLFDWGERKAMHDARADQLRAALAGYRSAVLQGVAQVETDLASLNATKQRVKHADDAVAASRHALTLSKRLQGLGEADQMNLIAARQGLVQTQLAEVQAWLQRGLAFVDLYKALGGAPLPEFDATPTSAPSAASTAAGS